MDTPDFVARHRNGNLHFERWTRGHLAHRENGPALITYREDGSRLSDEWMVDGELHRDGAPALTYYAEDGKTVTRELWHCRGEAHRVGAPADTEYDRQGRPEVQRWHREGRNERIDGPAVVIYDEDGKVEDEAFFFGGTEFESIAEIAQDLIEHCDDDDRRDALVDSPLEALLDEGVSAEAIIESIAQGVKTPEGMREVLGGAPAEWVRSWEEGRS